MSSALSVAAGKGNNEKVCKLLDKGADVNARDKKSGMTPLFATVMPNHTKTATLLINRGADVNIPNNDDTTPLHLAAMACQSAMVALLIDSGADVNARGNDGETPLHRVALTAHLIENSSWESHLKDRFEKVIALLVDRGADVNARKKDGRTPLYQALWIVTNYSMLGHPGWESSREVVEDRLEKVIALFIDRGADINIPDNDDTTPLNRATEKGFAKVADLLRKHGAIGADVNSQHKNDDALAVEPLTKALGDEDEDKRERAEALKSNLKTEEITEAQKAAIEKLLEDLGNEFNIEGRIKASEELGELNNFGEVDVVSALASASKKAAMAWEVKRMTAATMHGVRPEQIVVESHADDSRVTIAAIKALRKLANRKDETGKKSKAALVDIRKSIKNAELSRKIVF